MAAAKKSTPSPRKQAQIKENRENKVFLDLIQTYTKNRDFEMVEDLFDIYGRILHDREDSQT